MIRMFARFLARPAVVDWLIRRAQRTPYTHIVKDGSTYMERYWLLNAYPADSSGKGNWLPSVRLHKIMRPDGDRHLHDHPWNARTFILRGGYVEERPYTGIIARSAGDTARLRFGEYHRITYVPPEGVWTLFITWRYRGTWGFLVNGKKVPWRTYLGLES